MSRRYCFIEFLHKKTLKKIHKGKSKKKLGSKYYYIDFEKGRRSHHWLPQRLGGGKGEFERDYPKRYYKDIKILKKLYPELADDDDDLYSVISSSESISVDDKNEDDNYDNNENDENKNIDVDEYIRIEGKKSGNKKNYLIYNKEMLYEKDFEKIYGVRSDSKSIYRFNGYINDIKEELNNTKNDILNFDEKNDENKDENNNENDNNYKSRSNSFIIENLKEKKSRSISRNSNIRKRDRSRSINEDIRNSNNDLFRSKSRSLYESEEKIRKKRHKKRRKHKRKRKDKRKIKRESESEEIDERNHSFSTIRNMSKSISRKRSKSKSKSKSKNTIKSKSKSKSINNINIVKSEIESDSDATIILTAENRHKYELGEL